MKTATKFNLKLKKVTVNNLNEEDMRLVGGGGIVNIPTSQLASCESQCDECPPPLDTMYECTLITWCICTTG